jgi:hypothetical protein
MAQLQGASLLGAHLQGASFFGAKLQGASLDFAELQGANLEAAQLQGASLNTAQLQAASLLGAELQVASLGGAQLQGADLTQAQLQGAWLQGVSVWRTLAPNQQQLTGAQVAMPDTRPKFTGFGCSRSWDTCDWTGTFYTALKSMIQEWVPAGPRRAQALARVAKLEKPAYFPDQASAGAWVDLSKESSLSAASYPDTLVKTLIGVGCADDGAPYVISGLIQQLRYRFEQHPSQEAGVAKAFLDEAKCPGAHGLSTADKASLQSIVRQAPDLVGAGSK